MAVGMLDPYVGRIRETLLDHAIEYFCHGAISPGDDAQVRGFLNGFVASLPGVEAWALGIRNGRRWADAVEMLVESYEEHGWVPLWREHAAFEAIKASCLHIIGGNTI